MNLNKKNKQWYEKLPFFYGWIIIFIAAFTAFFTGPGQTYSFSMYINKFIEDFGWSRSYVSTLYTLATTASGLLMFLVGRLIDRIGAKFISVIAAVLLAISCFWLSFITSPFMLLIGFFLGRFSGQGTLGLVSGTLAPRWFVKKRGLAIMLAGLGGTAAASFYPLINNYLINSYGWHTSFRITGIGIIIFYIPLCLLLMKNKPEDIGMLPDGVTHEDISSCDVEEYNDENSLDQNQVFRTSAFYILCFSAFQAAFVGTGAQFHFVSIIENNGFNQNFAAKILSISPVAGFISGILAGLFIDKIKNIKYLLAGTTFISFAMYILMANMNTTTAAYIYAVFSGLSGSIFWLCHTYLRPYLFGRKYIAGISGLVAIATLVGSGLGAIPFGLAYDHFGGYCQILYIASSLPLIAAILTLFIKKPQLK